jgi:hypothetical protein
LAILDLSVNLPRRFLASIPLTHGAAVGPKALRGGLSWLITDHAVGRLGFSDNDRLSMANPSARLRNRKQRVERAIQFGVEVVDHVQAPNP